MKKLLLIIGSACSLLAAVAQPVGLAPWFANRGIYKQDFVGLNTITPSEAFDVYPLADGKALVVGSQAGFVYGGIASIMRLNTDGSRDLSFGTNGLAYMPNFPLYASALQSDGKILLSGYTEVLGNGRIAIARFNTNGTLDSSFGIHGRDVVTQLPNSLGYDMVVQANDAIVIAGSTQKFNPNTTFNDRYPIVVRRLANGGADASFGTNGVYEQPTSLTAGELYGVALSAAGDIYATGRTGSAGGNRMLTMRWTAAGTLDPVFEGDGIVIDMTDGNAFAYDVVMLPSGNLVIGGRGSAFNARMIQYTPGGNREASFGTDGIKTFDVPGYSQPVVRNMRVSGSSLLVLADVGGTQGSGYGIAKMSSSGAMDNSFDTDGFAANYFYATGFDYAYNMNLDASGKIYVAGQAQSGYSTYSTGVNRHNTDGTPDNGFDNDGRVVINIPSTDDVVNAVLRLSDGSILIGGGSNYRTATNLETQQPGNFSAAYVVKLLPNGTPDAAFGTLGVVIVQQGTFAGREVNALALQPDGKIVVVGNGFAMARLNANGSFDAGFGTNGVVPRFTVAPGTSSDNFGAGVDVEVQASGKLLILSTIGTNTFNVYNGNIGVIRLNANGTVDNTFGSQGTTQIGGSSQTSDETAIAMSLQDDGKIVVAGNTANNVVMTARLLVDGAPDATYAGTGKWLINPGASGGNISDMVLQPDQKAVLIGQRYNASTENTDLFMARILPEGANDATFGTGGVAGIDYGIFREFGATVGMDASGRFLVGVNGMVAADRYNFNLVRVLGNGSKDETFNGTGVFTVDAENGSDDRLLAAAYGPDMVYLAGNTLMPSQRDALVVAVGLSAGVLPAKFEQFNAQKQNGKTSLLSWTTLQEANTNEFVVERSADGVVFTAIGKQKAAGQNAGRSNYEFADNKPLAGNNYYRLKLMDKDGGFTQSGIRLLNFAEGSSLRVYPNPVVQQINIELGAGWMNKQTTFRLVNAQGKLVLHSRVIVAKHIHYINVSSLPSGTYYLQAIAEGMAVNQQVIIQR